MVRVLMCHNFKEHKVFSDAYEPTAVACSVSRDFVFVATGEGHVFVYSLVQDGFPQLFHFPLVSPSEELVFSDFGNYILTREITRKDRPNQFTARVYFNWSKWCKKNGKSSQKIRQHQIGFSLSRSFCLEPNALTAVEISSRFSVTALSCCPLNGNIGVATETTVSVFKRCVECPFDFQKVYIVEPGFSICKLAICEQFVAFASANEVRVLKVTFNGQSALSTEDNSSRDVFNTETDQFLVSGILSNSITQREVFDEHFVVWSFNQCPDVSPKQTFWENILASKEWSDSDIQGCNPTPLLVELPSISEEVPFIDYSDKPCEVFGPVKIVHGHPLKVLGSLSNAQDVTMLYRCFQVDTMKNSDVFPEIHTLQLVPFYTNDCSGNTERSYPQLSGMICFVSSSKEGVIYNVFTKTEFLSHCIYTSDTKTATFGENLLYAVTSQGIETYTVPSYAAVARATRATRPSDFDDKLEIPVPAPVKDNLAQVDEEISAGGSSVILSGTDGNVSSGDIESEEMLIEEESGTGDKNDTTKQTSYTNLAFPVYDLDILQKPCPSPCKDLCMIGVHRFTGVYSILTAGKRILLLSNATSSPPSRRHSKKAKEISDKENQTKDWTLHVLQAMDMDALYSKMESLTEKSESFNAQADLRLLKEQHLILRSQFQVGTSIAKKDALLTALRNSVKNLGDYYARYAVEQVENVMLYYTMASLSIEDVVNHHVQGSVDVDKIKDRKFGKGLVLYLNEVLFHKNQEKTCISLPQATADKVLYIYSNADPACLSLLILRPLIEGYTLELAAKLLSKLKKTKGYSFSTEDHLALAIVYLKLCALEYTSQELANLPKDKLADICVKRYYILYEKDETMSPLGQFLRRRLPKVFIKTLVSLHLRGIMSLKNTINLLQVKDCELHNNTHLVDFLELVLNDQKGKESFKEARELLIEIYFKKLFEDTAAQARDVLRLPHNHVPRGSGHFSKRFPWLDTLPPFNGFVSEPKDCPYLNMASISAVSSRGKQKFLESSPNRSSSLTVAITGSSRSCTCCCCWITLLKLQSLLCSRYCDEELGEFVLSKLLERSSPADISITLLCLPLVGEREKAVELLLETQPSVVLSYGKQYFGDSHVKWKCVLNVLTNRTRVGKNVEKNHDIYKEILQETLTILSKSTTPSVFLSLLPSDGNFAFFLPFVVQCCQKTAAQELSNQITAKSSNPRSK